MAASKANEYKYVIMADGNGTRWNNYQNVPKHLIKIDGETILARTVRLLNENGITDIIITSHDPRYDVEGAIRYEPLNNIYEIDRFTDELIEGQTCFLYGDVYYTEKAIKKILKTKSKDVAFIGKKAKIHKDWPEIIAVKVKNCEMFKNHIRIVREAYLSRKINRCIGWEVYKSINHIPLEKFDVKGGVVWIGKDETTDFDFPEELDDWLINRYKYRKTLKSFDPIFNFFHRITGISGIALFMAAFHF